MYMMSANKKETTERIFALGKQIPCTKLEMKNIIFPKWDELGLLGLMLRQCVVTKEQPQGNIYDETKFRIVMRIIRGRVLMEGKPDCYCWKFDKVEKATDKHLIGSNSAEGMKNACSLLTEIEDEKERTLFADMLASLKRDLIVATTPAEKRTCIEITQELYDKGVTFCVDSWMEVDESGMALYTALNVGDFLIVEGDSVYCIRHKEFMLTHELG